MRTLIDIPNHQRDALDHLAAQEKVSRAELVRRAISNFLEQRRTERSDSAFGLWANRSIDGVAYQKQLRDEWQD